MSSVFVCDCCGEIIFMDNWRKQIMVENPARGFTGSKFVGMDFCESCYSELEKHFRELKEKKGMKNEQT